MDDDMESIYEEAERRDRERERFYAEHPHLDPDQQRIFGVHPFTRRKIWDAAKWYAVVIAVVGGLGLGIVHCSDPDCGPYGDRDCTAWER